MRGNALSLSGQGGDGGAEEIHRYLHLYSSFALSRKTQYTPPTLLRNITERSIQCGVSMRSEHLSPLARRTK